MFESFAETVTVFITLISATSLTPVIVGLLAGSVWLDQFGYFNMHLFLCLFVTVTMVNCGDSLEAKSGNPIQIILTATKAFAESIGLVYVSCENMLYL